MSVWDTSWFLTVSSVKSEGFKSNWIKTRIYSQFETILRTLPINRICLVDILAIFPSPHNSQTCGAKVIK